MSLPIVIAIGVGALVAIVLALSGRNGPRVTTIETRQERDDTGDGA